MSAELEEVDIEQELAKSEGEDAPTLTIQTQPLTEADVDIDLEKDATGLSQKELLASLIEGSPDETKSSQSPLEEGEVDETQLSQIPLEVGEVDVAQLSQSPLEEGEVDETQLNKSPLEEGEVDETKLNQSPLEEGEVDETQLNQGPTEDDTSDEEDDNMFYRNLEDDVDTNILKFYHPETENINYKELLTLSNISRNKKGHIIDPFHKTIPFLTQYEKAKILGQRAKQINHGSTPFVDVPSNIIDGHTIAMMELTQKKIPFIIRRPLPNGTSEYWKVKDLKIMQ